MKISLCMIVKNEEENIVNCLDRALEVVDEAIVVDTGSTDKTKDLLIKNYEENNKVKIYDEKWENDFSKARNKSLEDATGDWILVLDADERVFCNRDRLEKFLNNSEALAYKIPIYNIFDKNNFTVSTSMIRLFKNNNPKYKGAIHEQIQIDGNSYIGEVLDENICRIYHYGYNSNVFKEKNKSQRNMDIINAEIEKNPRDPFNWYNKGVMEMIEGNYNTALDDFIKAHSFTNNVRMSYHNDLLVRMIQSMIMLKNYKQAAKFIEDISKDSYINVMPDIYYYLGICYMKLKKYDIAINNFKKAVDIGEYSEGISKFGAGSFLSLIEWAKTLELKNEKLLATEKYKEAVFNENNVGMQGLDELRRILKEENMIDELNQLDKAISSINNKEELINSSNEMEKFKKEFKNNIQVLIESGMLKEAKEAVKEYEEIAKDDIDVYSIKGVIAMMEGDIDEAEKVLRDGLDSQLFNCDLLYNMAYLYEAQKKYITAYRYYKKIIKVGNEEVLSEAKERIQELLCIEAVKDYSKRKRVLFIAHIFPPVGGSGVQRSLKFVKYLRDFGWEPVVVTVGETRYPLKDKTLTSEIPSEIEIIRIDEATSIDTKYANQLIQLYSGVINDTELMEEYIKELNKSQNHLNQLILIPDLYILWATEVLDKIDDKVDFEEIDIIYSTSGPYSDHIIGYYLKQKYDKPWVADFRDEWTNNPYVKYDKSSIRYKMDFTMEKKIIDKAEQIITPTSVSKGNYDKTFSVDACKVKVITNGYDEEDFADLNMKETYKNKFTIIHNGLLYMIRTPETFLVAIENLIKKNKIDKSKISIIFPWIEDEKYWSNYIKEKALEDIVRITGYLTHEESLNLAAEADLLLLIIGKGDENKAVYTGKVFEYLRLCKPILSLSPKESLVEKLIDETNRGKNVEFDDIDGMEDYVLKMYKDWEMKNTTDLKVTSSITKYERRHLTESLSNLFLESLNYCDKFEGSNGEYNRYMLLKEKNSSHYDKAYESGGWNETYFKHYSETHYYEIWNKALNLIKDVPNPNIIDIGCGPGQFANMLFDNNVKSYRGIDFSQEAIKYAKIRNDKYRNLFSIDNAYTSTIFEEDYNLVIIFEVLEHVDDDLKILSKIKGGTKILFSVPNFYSDGHVRWFNSKNDVIQRYNKQLLIENIFTFIVGGNNKIYLVEGQKY